MTFVHSSRHVKALCYGLEDIPNKHSRSLYLHILKVFQDYKWLRSRWDIFEKVG